MENLSSSLHRRVPRVQALKNHVFQIKAKTLDLSYWKLSGAGSPLVYKGVAGPRNTHQYAPAVLGGHIQPSLLPAINKNTAYSLKETILNISAIFEP